ncbi:MAG: AtpZ/AtpI family protein [Cyclobacterium sp.]|uniref:AtpZ/AtpI family protein n=1 Tax=unclassified Cyclobacterium TaxID=2615055 RepID=UPI0013D65B4D|nr:AtpZ/AtpI family protein [Cyclobacterium sp. SYSU L10401]
MRTPKNKSPQTEPPVYVKYFGLAFQMCAIIGLGTYLGYRLHLKSGMSFPLYLLIGCFLSIAIAFYQLFKSLQSDEEK